MHGIGTRVSIGIMRNMPDIEQHGVFSIEIAGFGDFIAELIVVRMLLIKPALEKLMRLAELSAMTNQFINWLHWRPSFCLSLFSRQFAECKR